MLSTVTLLLVASQAVNAHFQLVQPPWRADTLSVAGEAKYSQWLYPCGGVPYSAGNTTDWPLDGGALELNLHHPWTYVFVNLGLGANTTNFNFTLTEGGLWNTTGNGTFCVDKLAVPAGIAEGQLASLQVVTSGASGSALYNCADIRFTKNATLGKCKTNGVTLSVINAQNSATGSKNSSASSTTSAAAGAKETGSGKSNAGANAVNGGVLTTVVGAAALFAMGMSL